MMNMKRLLCPEPANPMITAADKNLHAFKMINLIFVNHLSVVELQVLDDLVGSKVLTGHPKVEQVVAEVVISPARIDLLNKIALEILIFQEPERRVAVIEAAKQAVLRFTLCYKDLFEAQEQDKDDIQTHFINRKPPAATTEIGTTRPTSLQDIATEGTETTPSLMVVTPAPNIETVDTGTDASASLENLEPITTKQPPSASISDDFLVDEQHDIDNEAMQAVEATEAEDAKGSVRKILARKQMTAAEYIEAAINKKITGAQAILQDDANLEQLNHDEMIAMLDQADAEEEQKKKGKDESGV